MASKRGLDFIKAAVGYVSRNNGYDSILKSVQFINGGSGSAVAELKVAPEHLNGGGGLHGGCIATLVDQITTMGLMTHEKNSVPGVSVDLHVNYIKGAREGDEIIIEANTIKAGANLAFTECVIKHKKDGSVIAHGTHTKFVGQENNKSVRNRQLLTDPDWTTNSKK